MVNCEDVLHFLDTYLNSAQIPDMSHNGLQVEGTPRVGKIVFGVSASLALFRQAKEAGADMVLVHHGLLWGQEQAVTGLFKERVAFLLKNDIPLKSFLFFLKTNMYKKITSIKHKQYGYLPLTTKILLPFQ